MAEQMKANQKDLDKFINKGVKLVHSPESRDKLLNILNSGNPIQTAATATVEIVKRLEQAAGKTGAALDSVTKLTGANLILGEIIQLGEASGKLPKMSDDEKLAAFSVAVQDYVKDGIATGRLDQNALSQQVGETVQGMNPKEQKEADSAMLRINDAATGATKQTVQGNVQQGVLGGTQ